MHVYVSYYIHNQLFNTCIGYFSKRLSNRHGNEFGDSVSWNVSYLQTFKGY